MEQQGRERLLIKHQLGRLLFDTALAGAACTFQQGDDCYLLTVTGIHSEKVSVVKRYARDLNLFRFIEFPDGSVKKWWLYDKQSPQMEYSEEQSKLVIRVDTCVRYSNESALFKGD